MNVPDSVTPDLYRPGLVLASFDDDGCVDVAFVAFTLSPIQPDGTVFFDTADLANQIESAVDRVLASRVAGGQDTRLTVAAYSGTSGTRISQMDTDPS